MRNRILAAVAYILIVTGVGVMLYTAAPDEPNCPTEDSCTVDYHDGAWHVTEQQP
jgi:hypothetical protein